ncbi:MAG: histidine phosphatase family protein [Verrucomicrobiae bacterium]
MEETCIILIRHGIRQDFADPSWKLTAQEPNDTPLAEAGLRQGEDIARALEGSGIRAIYCSPFLRALQTAAPASMKLGIPLRIEPGFGEWLNPEWFSSLPRLLSLREAAGVCPLVDVSYIPLHSPAGLELDETVEVRARVKIALEAILQRSPGESFAVVAHGSPLGQSAEFLLGSLDGVDLRMGAITRIACGDGGFRLISSGSDHLGDEDSHLRFH